MWVPNMCISSADPFQPLYLFIPYPLLLSLINLFILPLSFLTIVSLSDRVLPGA